MTTTSIIARYRLYNQHIIHNTVKEPYDIVRRMGAIQAQDYLAALWAIGLRVEGANETAIEQAIAERSIVRTWPMRGTLHFVAAADIRWILDLLGPRMIARAAGRYLQLGLDEDTFARSRDLFVIALQGNRQLTRAAMYQVLENANISTAGQRGIHILGRLAQEGLLCFGERQGKQFTFALLSEWIPQAKSLPREQAQAELALRYFSSHGPAMLEDFVWWSGLTSSDARAALDMAKPRLASEVIDGRTYWLPISVPALGVEPIIAHLIPAFDEYLVGYKDRSAVLDPQFFLRTNAGGGMLNPTILIDGQVLGTWKRTFKKGAVVIKPEWFTELTNDQLDAFNIASENYGAFLQLPVTFA